VPGRDLALAHHTAGMDYGSLCRCSGETKPGHASRRIGLEVCSLAVKPAHNLHHRSSRYFACPGLVVTVHATCKYYTHKVTALVVLLIAEKKLKIDAWQQVHSYAVKK
jgi:hypothetical protein